MGMWGGFPCYCLKKPRGGRAEIWFEDLLRAPLFFPDFNRYLSAASNSALVSCLCLCLQGPRSTRQVSGS